MINKSLSQEELEEKFEMFLFIMSDSLEQLEKKALEQGLKFDYTIESLIDVEKYIVKNKITINDNYNDLASYIGEFVRKKYGGKWTCNLDNINNSLYYGFPVITGHTSYDVLFSPFHLVKAYLIRPKERLFENAIKSQINPQKIDWNRFPTES